MDQRLEKIRTSLTQQSLDAAFISNAYNILYLSGYSGFSSEERDAYLLITQKKAYIITNALYITAVREQITHLEPIEQSRDQTLNKILGKIIKEENISTFGFENENLTVAEYKSLEGLNAQFKPINLETLRNIKITDEIDSIQKACAIGDQAFIFIQKQLKPNISEIEVAHALELFIKQQGADISFRSIVAFGKNAAIPHHLSGKDTLQKNSCVLLDFGVKYQNYCSDMTRTIFFGHASDEHQHVYETVLAAQQKAIDTLRDRLEKEAPEKIAMKDIDQVAREYIVAAGFPTIPHTLGHGIGLEVHEGIRLAPNSHSTFSNGMVFSIEPGIYLPGNIGVRIEDLLAIQKNKLVQLTNSSRDFKQLA